MKPAASAHVPLSHFPALAQHVNQHFNAVAAAKGPLFVVDPGVDLYDLYLDNLPSQIRQEHTCSCCRTFIHRFGALVCIGADGMTESAIWPQFAADHVEVYWDAIKAMRQAVSRAPVKSVFLASETMLGVPHAGGFEHFAVLNPQLFSASIMTAGQAMAQKREHFGTLNRALAEFSSDTVNQALTLLESDSLYRADKVIHPARFLKATHDAVVGAKGKDAKRNLVWRAVAAGSAGDCTPRSSMIGTLLEDIAAGLDFGDVSRKFKAKMHPLQYLRPQVDASAGAIARAEEIFNKMGLAPSLRRRFARLDEIKTIWRTVADAPEETKSGVFAELKPRNTVKIEPMVTPPVNITWEKFHRTVLPGALTINVRLEHSNYGALVTAVDPEAPLLFRWDHPFSWYLYHGGSAPSHWGLTHGAWGKVNAIAMKPDQWDRQGESGDPGAIMIIDGAKDIHVRSLALFPETLRPELHEVRRVVEQFSKANTIEGFDEATACGLILGRGNTDVIRVRSAIGTSFYRIDRWD